MYNLILAFAWGLIGVALIVYHATTGDSRGRIALLGGISPGWVALFISVYNLAHWWVRRSLVAEKKKPPQQNSGSGNAPRR